MSDISPKSVTVEVAGESIVISPVRFGKMPALVNLVAPIGPALASGDLLRVLREKPEAVLEVVTLLSGKPREWVDELYPDDAVVLAAACIEVNLDFFVQSVAPKATESVTKITERITSMLPKN